MSEKRNNFIDASGNSPQDIEKIMRKIESETEKIILTGYKTGKIVNPINAINGLATKTQIEQSQETLMSIMKKGADDFESKVGRPMTYSEMRALYG